jgi:hypothetical protein
MPEAFNPKIFQVNSNLKNHYLTNINEYDKN